MLNHASHFRQQCEFDKALDYSISSFAVGASEFHYFQEKGYNKILWKEFADVPIIKNKGLFGGIIYNGLPFIKYINVPGAKLHIAILHTHFRYCYFYRTDV